MATAAVNEMLSVVVINRNDPQKNDLFTLGSDATIAEVKGLWQEIKGDASPTIFCRDDRVRLNDFQRLEDVGEVIPGCKTVTLFAEEGIEMTVGFYRRHIDEQKTLVVSRNEKPEDIHGEIRMMFCLEDDQLFRMITRAAPLRYDLTFAEQEVGAGTCLQIDLGFVLEIMDEWSSTVHPRLFFASEAASDLLTDDDDPQRLLLGGVKMELHRDMLTALPAQDRMFARIFLQHQSTRTVTAVSNGVVKQRKVWPADVVGKMMKKCVPCHQLFFEKQRLPENTTFKQGNLPDHAIVHTVIRVSVKCSDGKRRFFRLPEFATVADLETAVCKVEGKTQLSLKCGERFLNKSDKISKVSMDDRSIEVSSPTVTVRLPDRSVRFTSDQSQLNFTEIMKKVAEKGRVKFRALVKRELQCEGCRRRLTIDEEEFQCIPANCCRVQSMKLFDSNPVVLKDAGSHGSWKTGDRVRIKRVGSRSGRISAAQQTAKKRTTSSIQCPAPHPFAVFNDLKVGQGRGSVRIRGEWIPAHYSFTDLPVTDLPTAGEILTAAAAHLAVSATEVTLWRTIGRCKTSGETVFGVRDDEGSKGGLGTAAGRWKDHNEATWKTEELRNEDPFPVVPFFTNTIVVLRR